MSLELPKAGNVFLPQVPSSVKYSNPDIYEWMQKVREALMVQMRGAFDNSLLIADAINSGVSGTFVISSGGSIVVTSGIVISVTS
jgi:hypothetical protein